MMMSIRELCRARKKVCLALLVATLAIMGVIVSSVLASKQTDQKQASSQNTATIEFVSEPVNKTTPTPAYLSCQQRARNWLAGNAGYDTFTVYRAKQRFALAVFYCEMNGDDWVSNRGWMSDQHECDWFSSSGVDPCSRYEEYQILDLHSNGLVGTIPQELSLISSLWEVTLSDNLIYGTIPTDFARLSQLDTFMVEDNLVEGPIPDFIWFYYDMAYLNLANNHFTGTIPKDLHWTEPNLKFLLLSKNSMSGEIPDALESHDWVRLHLNDNNFTGTVPGGLASFQMEELRLDGNNLSGEFPVAAFTEFPLEYLRDVTLHDNNLSGSLHPLCHLFFDGQLKLMTADLDMVECMCCVGNAPPAPAPAPFSNAMPPALAITVAPTRDRCFGNMFDHRFCQSDMPSGTNVPSNAPVKPNLW